MQNRFIGIFFVLICVLLPAACGEAAVRSYDAEFVVEFLPSDAKARITLKIFPGEGSVKQMNFKMRASRYSDIKGDGKIERIDNRVLWIVPKKGGTLSYLYDINHQRQNDGYDALITDKWAIVRGDDLFPPVKVITSRNTDSSVRLKFKLPTGWSNAETPYVLSRDKKSFVIVNPKRKFDRPVGWIIAGEVGTRRDYLDGVEVVVAAPRGESMRRMDVIAFSNLIMPKMRSAFINLPPKILIVGAGDPMWRGGLSAPRSMFLHAERPMISENSTSSLVHELTHVVTRIRGQKGDDWITEGIAEFYSLELMRRAGIITERRYKKAKEFAKSYGSKISSLRTSDSSGSRTARAVVLLISLDAEIRKRTDGSRTIDDLTQKLIEIGRVNTDDIINICERLIGGKAETLKTKLLDPAFSKVETN